MSVLAFVWGLPGVQGPPARADTELGSSLAGGVTVPPAHHILRKIIAWARLSLQGLH